MGELYATESWLQVLFVTGILGGGAAWLTGRACADTWRPLHHVIGYTILLGTTGGTVSGPALGVKVSYDPAKDFAPISYLVDVPYTLVTYGGLPPANVRELIDLANASPGKLNFGSPGTGTPGSSTGGTHDDGASAPSDASIGARAWIGYCFPSTVRA